MATKTRKKWDGKWRGFMDIPLTAEMKEECRSWDADGDGTEELIGAFVGGGYKLAFTWNEKTQSVIVSATGQESAGDNAGYTLSAHAKSVGQAVHVLAFKHIVICEGNWHREGVYQQDEDFG